MASSFEASEFEWLANASIANSKDMENFQFLKDGYLHMTEEEVDHIPHGIYSSPMTDSNKLKEPKQVSLVRRTSDPSLKGSWKYRWCVLSQTADGVHLLYYKHKASFTNCEAPCGVVLLEGCTKLYTIPTCSKSRNAFALAFPQRIVTFYTDTRTELEAWLETFKKALNLQDETSNQLPLKGLPKQKALRKDFHAQPWPNEQELPTQRINDKRSSTKRKEEAKFVQPLSFRSLTEETDSSGLQPQAQQVSKDLKGLPKTKALHARLDPGYQGSSAEKDLYKDVPVPDLDSESVEDKNPVQFLGFRMLNT